MSNDKKVYDLIMAKLEYQYEVYSDIEDKAYEEVAFEIGFKAMIKRQVVNQLIMLIQKDEQIQELIK